MKNHKGRIVNNNISLVVGHGWFLIVFVVVDVVGGDARDGRDGKVGRGRISEHHTTTSVALFRVSQ